MRIHRCCSRRVPDPHVRMPNDRRTEWPCARRNEVRPASASQHRVRLRPQPQQPRSHQQFLRQPERQRPAGSARTSPWRRARHRHRSPWPRTRPKRRNQPQPRQLRHQRSAWQRRCPCRRQPSARPHRSARWQRPHWKRHPCSTRQDHRHESWPPHGFRARAQPPHGKPTLRQAAMYRSHAW